MVKSHEQAGEESVQYHGFADQPFHRVVEGAWEAHPPVCELTQGHISSAGYYDPLSVYLLLGAVVDSTPGVAVRARNLQAWLQEHATGLSWHPHATGRILAEIDAMVGVVIPNVPGAPIRSGNDWKGEWMMIDPEGGDVGRRFLGGLYGWMGERVKEELDYEARFSKRWVTSTPLEGAWVSLDVADMRAMVER